VSEEIEAKGFVAYPLEGLMADDLAKLLASHFGEVSYAILGRVDAIEFCRIEQGKVEPRCATQGMVDFATLVAWSAEGRAFSRSLEARWRKADDLRYEVLILTEDSQLGHELEKAEGWQSQEWTVVPSVETHGFYLWGKRKSGKDEWVESRIPRPLIYPAVSVEPRVSYVRYTAPDGSSQFIRLIGVS
jgi:hypothetical protein